MDPTALLGQVVLGEHRLDAIAREDEALVVYRATSMVDGGTYAVVLAKHVLVDTASTVLESAVERAGRHAVGIKSVLPLLHARAVGEGADARLGAVRRGDPGDALTFDAPLSLADVVRTFEPLVSGLRALHDQGLAHGAISAVSIARRGGELALDFFGLSAAAEAANGSKGAQASVAPAYRAPELAAPLPTSPGPWTDTYAIALLVVGALAGRADVARTIQGKKPTPRSLGIAVADRVERVLARALADRAADRPSLSGLFEELVRARGEPERWEEAPPGEGDRGGASPHVPISGRAAVEAPKRAVVAPKRTGDVAPRETVEQAEARDPALRTLGILMALGLGVFVLATAAGVLYVFRYGTPLTPTSPPPLATALPPPLAPPAPMTPPLPTTPLPHVTPPRASGPTTYPADRDALIPIEDDAIVRGDRDALLTVVVFGAITCPFTAREIAAIPALEARYGGDLRVVFKHFPLPGDDGAERASEALATVQARGGSAVAWRFLEAAAADHDRLDDGRLEELAIKAGVPAGAVTDGLARHAGRAAVERDVELGRRLGARGTPVVLVNGRRFDGFETAATLALFLDAELKRARDELRRVPREKLYAARVVANVTTSEGEAPFR